MARSFRARPFMLRDSAAWYTCQQKMQYGYVSKGNATEQRDDGRRWWCCGVESGSRVMVKVEGQRSEAAEMIRCTDDVK